MAALGSAQKKTENGKKVKDSKAMFAIGAMARRMAERHPLWQTVNDDIEETADGSPNKETDDD